MDKAVPSSTEFQGGGWVLQTDVISKGDPFFRITLVEPVNVGIYPGKDKVNPTRRYKERSVRYMDAPRNRDMMYWYLRYTANNDKTPLFIESKKGCELFVAPSNIASINLRSEYPSKKFLYIQKVRHCKNKILIIAGYLAHMAVLVSCNSNCH